MYSKEDREKAIMLYIKYDKSAAAVIRELGYPDRKTLACWYKEYIRTGDLSKPYSRRSKYSLEQKNAAVKYYLEHGRNFSRTIKALGFPSREVLREWVREMVPDYQKNVLVVIEKKFTQEEKKEAVIDLCVRTGAAKDIAKTYGISRETLYNWKNELIPGGVDLTMADRPEEHLIDDRDALLKEIETMKQQIRRLKMEIDIWEKAAEIIKKDPGVAPKKLTNKEKTLLVDALKNEHPLKELLAYLELPRSSYFYHRKIASLPDKYHELKYRIKEIFEKSNKCYGYRRIHTMLAREGTRVSEKVVRRIMSECSLHVPMKKKRRYNAYQGESAPAADNLLNRDFHADAPNMKWVTDITEFSIPAGKVYLSPIIDCFDGLVISWAIGTSPNADLVNSMLDRAVTTLKDDEHPVIHSDRGSHYRWPGWVSRIAKAGLKQSMSKKGCPEDNAACEGFFGRLKNEMFYHRSWRGVRLDEFIDILNKYLIWYNEERIKVSLGGMSPMEYRQSIGLAA